MWIDAVPDTSRCLVHGAQGEAISVYAPCPTPPETARVPTHADKVPVTAIMTRELVCARTDLRGDAVVRLMMKHHVGCLPVVDERCVPRGIITKYDVVELVERVSRMRDGDPVTVDLSWRTAGDIMMPLSITLDDQATVAHAASLMTLEDLHHVMIVSPTTGVLVGVVSSKDIVRWLVDNDELVGHAS